jgi:hypothetical protein
MDGWQDKQPVHAKANENSIIRILLQICSILYHDFVYRD